MNFDELRGKVRSLVTEALNDLFLDLDELGENPRDVETALWLEAPLNLPSMWRKANGN